MAAILGGRLPGANDQPLFTSKPVAVNAQIVEVGGKIIKICNGIEYILIDGDEPQWKPINNIAPKVT